GTVGAFFGKSVCPAVLGTQNFMASDVRCDEFNDAVVRYLKRHPSIKHVVLVGVWAGYDAKSTEGEEVSFAAGLERTLALMREMNIRVTIIDQVPKIAYDVPSHLARSEHFGNALDLRSPRGAHGAQPEPLQGRRATRHQRSP